MYVSSVGENILPRSRGIGWVLRRLQHCLYEVVYALKELSEFSLILPTRLLWVEEREEAAEAAATDQPDKEGEGAGRRTRQLPNVLARWAHVLR